MNIETKFVLIVPFMELKRVINSQYPLETSPS